MSHLFTLSQPVRCFICFYWVKFMPVLPEQESRNVMWGNVEWCFYVLTYSTVNILLLRVSLMGREIQNSAWNGMFLVLLYFVWILWCSDQNGLVMVKCVQEGPKIKALFMCPTTLFEKFFLTCCNADIFLLSYIYSYLSHFQVHSSTWPSKLQWYLLVMI